MSFSRRRLLNSIGAVAFARSAPGLGIPATGVAQEKTDRIAQRVAAIQFEPKLGDINFNLSRADALVREALNKGARWVVLPEFFPSGNGTAPVPVRFIPGCRWSPHRNAEMTWPNSGVRTFVVPSWQRAEGTHSIRSFSRAQMDRHSHMTRTFRQWSEPPRVSSEAVWFKSGRHWQAARRVAGSSLPRLRPAGCCRWAPAAGDC